MTEATNGDDNRIVPRHYIMIQWLTTKEIPDVCQDIITVPVSQAIVPVLISQAIVPVPVTQAIDPLPATQAIVLVPVS